MDIAVADAEWTDPSRGRVIPLRVYLPAGGQPAPVVVLSHATGGSRAGYAYLGRHWAEHGYVSVHLQHPGSDVDCWRGKGGGAVAAMRRAAADPQNAVDRVADLRFALDRVDAGDSPLHGRVDPGRVGVAGHSFGALTALAVAGQRFLTPGGEEVSFADPRARAVLAMSSPLPWSTGAEALARTFTAVRVPCLHFTGTRDDSPLNDTRAVDRRIPFDHLRGSDQILVTFAEGEHMVFAGDRRLFAGDPREAVIHGVVRRASLAFWDAHLRGDGDAARWLLDGGLTALLGGDGVVEARRA